MADVLILKESLRDADFEVTDDSILQRFLALCTQFDLNNDDLIDEYDAYAMNKKVSGKAIGSKQLDNFREHLVSTRKKNVKLASSNFYFSKDDIETMPDSIGAATPFARGPSTFGKPTPAKTFDVASVPMMASLDDPDEEALEVTKAKAGSAFSKRAQSGTVQVALNEQVPARSADAAPMEVDGGEEGPCSRVEVLGTPLPAGVRYMYDRLEGKVAALEERVVAFSAAVMEHLGLESLHPVHVASQVPVVVVGRVCCDSEGRLNAQSVELEGSIKHSGGHRVRVDLSKLPSYSLFPGQIVAVEGNNPGGHVLVATRVISSVPVPMAAAPSREEAAKMAEASGGAGFSVMAAAGPYSSTEDLAYEPLEALLNAARDKRPDVLLLAGPFVDAEHPLLSSGMVDMTFDQVFAARPRALIEAYCHDCPGARVLLVPSTRDVHHDCVFPQPALPADEWDGDVRDQVVCLPNPCTVKVGGVVVGCSTHPVVQHLAGHTAERAAAGESVDRMGRLFGHVVGQRSYYPLFPPAPGACLDLAHHAVAGGLPVTPDVLLLPSSLNPVAKKVAAEAPGKEGAQELGKVVCINPGRLTKGSAGGTFVHLHVAAPAMEEGAEVAPAHERLRVEIVKV